MRNCKVFSINKEHKLLPTMYKNNSQFSSKLKGCSPLQLLCNLTGKYHTVGNYSYTKRYRQLHKPITTALNEGILLLYFET